MLSTGRRTILNGSIGYVGPGDIVPGAVSCWGLRAYNAAYCQGGQNPCIDVVDTATGAKTTTINIRQDGLVNVETIAALGYGVSISKWYDMTGNGHHQIQATLANMVTVTLNNLNGIFPTANYNGSSTWYTEAGTTAFTQPISLSHVVKSNNSNNRFWRTTNTSTGHNTSANLYQIFNGNVVTISATDDAYHMYQCVLNGASSSQFVDGTDSGTQDAGANTTGTVAQSIGGNGSIFLNGVLQETTVWNTIALTAQQKVTLNNNQRLFWKL